MKCQNKMLKKCKLDDDTLFFVHHKICQRPDNQFLWKEYGIVRITLPEPIFKIGPELT